MPHRPRIGWLAAGPLLALLACSGTEPGAPTFDQEATAALTTAFAQGAGYTMPVLARDMNFGFPEQFLAGQPSAPFASEVDPVAIARTGVPEGCTFESRGYDASGYAVDVDQNGIPDDAYWRMECLHTDSTSRPDTILRSYTFEEQGIKENFHSLHGVTLARSGRSRYSDNFGHTSAGGGSFTGVLDVEPTGATLQTELSDNVTSDDFGFWGLRSEGVHWTATFIPDHPIPRAGPLPDGGLAVSGTHWSTDPAGASVSFSISTPTPLRYLAICTAAGTSPAFTSGTVEGLLNGRRDQAQFTTTFPACGQMTTATANTNGFAGP